eukprot:8190940-Ditylum_brightwellii.AAC.1
MYSDKKGRAPKYMSPAPGRPDWIVYCAKVLYWCNVCNAWNTTHFTKTTEGINIPSYLKNATVNGHQCRTGKRTQAQTKGSPSNSTSCITFASVQKPSAEWLKDTLLDCK